jgi:hypothetical protein
MLLLIASLGCARDAAVRYPGAGPVAAFQRHGVWLYVYLDSGRTLADVADMTQFGAIAPGSPLAQAAMALGEPVEKRTRQAGAEYWVYGSQYGKYWVGSEQSADGDTAYPAYFYPFDTRPGSFISSQVLRYVRQQADDERVMVFVCGFAQPALQVLMKAGRIDRVIWIAERDTVARRNRNQCVE